MNNESRKRTIVRTLSYRLTALLFTSIIVGINTAVFIHIVLSIWHYVLERIWLKINWGRK
jgi:uncharacterized membrane protein